MKKLLIICLCCFYSVFSDIKPIISEDGLSFSIINNTEKIWSLGGVMFKNNGFNWTSIDSINDMVYIKSKDSTQIITFKSLIHNTKFLPSDTVTIKHSSVSNISGSKYVNGSETVFLKTSTADILEIPKSYPSIKIEQIDSLSILPSFYDDDYRYIDTLGSRGGISSGGLLDTWLGETQLQFAFNNDTVVPMMNSPTTILCDSSNLMYWMALVVLQEYYNIDMQFLMAFGMRESMAGTSTFMYSDQQGVYGPYQIECTTGLDRALCFPQYFPEHMHELQSVPSVTLFYLSPDQFMDSYTNSGIRLSHPEIVNNLFIAMTLHYSSYISLSFATDICWKKAIEISRTEGDPFLGTHALGAIYNLGSYNCIGSIASSLNPQNVEENARLANASNLFPIGQGDYQNYVVSSIDVITNSSKLAYIDKSIKLWDIEISWGEIEELFLGRNGTFENQGHGGLLKHLTVSDIALRTKIINTLNQAYNKLKGKSPLTLGKETISFRYDLLTVLRSVKEFFKPDNFYQRIYSGDWSNLILRHSSGVYGSCSVVHSDSTYPELHISDRKISDEITININAIDNSSIKEVKWTTNSDWKYWDNAEPIPGTGGNQDFTLTIPQDQKGNGEDNTSTIVWIMATDENGNSTVKKEIIKENVGVFKLNKSKLSNIDLQVNKNRIKLNFDKNSLNDLVSIDLYSLNGKKVKSLKSFKKSKEGIIIPIDMVNSGMYILKLKGRNYVYDYKLNVLK